MKHLKAPEGKVYLDKALLQTARELYLPDNVDEALFHLCTEEEATAYIEERRPVVEAQAEACTLDVERSVLISKIKAHDESSAVNSFTVAGVPFWIDKATRASLRQSISIERDYAKRETTRLYIGTHAVTLPIDTALDMLAQIELYALEAYRVTTYHLAEAEKLDSVDAIDSYDYKAGYPEKLAFNLG